MREDHHRGVVFLEHRGFKEIMRSGKSRLAVASFAEKPYASLETRLLEQDIHLKTLSELETDPDRDRILYDLEYELDHDVIGFEGSRQDFEPWLDSGINNSDIVQPEGYIVAIHKRSRSSDYIGLSQLWADRGSAMLYTGLTGVKRAYRRRGVATAMKLKSIQFAKRNGNSYIMNSNEISNQAMLSINERLGFERQPDWIEYEKLFPSEGSSPFLDRLCVELVFTKYVTN